MNIITTIAELCKKNNIEINIRYNLGATLVRITRYVKLHKSLKSKRSFHVEKRLEQQINEYAFEFELIRMIDELNKSLVDHYGKGIL